MRPLAGLTLAAVLVTAFFVPGPKAQGLGRCGPYEDLKRWLAQAQGEAPEARGLTVTGSLIEVYRSRSGETWSVVVTSPEGWSCIKGWGADWERVEWSLPKTGENS